MMYTSSSVPSLCFRALVVLTFPIADAAGAYSVKHYTGNSQIYACCRGWLLGELMT